MRSPFKRLSLSRLLTLLLLAAFLLVTLHGLFRQTVPVHHLTSEGLDLGSEPVTGSDLVFRATTHLITLQNGRVVQIAPDAPPDSSGPACPT